MRKSISPDDAWIFEVAIIMMIRGRPRRCSTTTTATGNVLRLSWYLRRSFIVTEFHWQGLARKIWAGQTIPVLFDNNNDNRSGLQTRSALYLNFSADANSYTLIRSGCTEPVWCPPYRENLSNGRERLDHLCFSTNFSPCSRSHSG